MLSRNALYVFTLGKSPDMAIVALYDHNVLLSLVCVAV